MMIYDLACPQGHRFEGWFGSSGEYEDQQGEGLIACPQCGSIEIEKAPMAPAVGAKGNRSGSAMVPRDIDSQNEGRGDGDAVSGGSIPLVVAKALDALAKVQAKALESSEYVGEKFAEQSRAIHYGEREEATIHGKASDKERQELVDEGITVMPLLAPFVPPEDVN